MNLSRRDFVKYSIAGSILSLSGPAFCGSKKKPNILFIAVDDLRPQLGCYGFSQMKSPNIDRLAGSGVLFERAYCQQAVCLPSRISLMTGLRPDTTKVQDLQTDFRKTIPDAVLLPQYLKEIGYYTVGMGKILHTEEPSSWDQWHDIKTERQISDYHTEEVLRYVEEKVAEAKKLELKGADARKFTKGPATEMAEKPDNSYHDGAMTDVAIDFLQKRNDQPFFLAVGFKKPHLPFTAPKKYWDLYNRVSLPMAPNPYPPKGSPQIAHMSWGELRAFNDIPNDYEKNVTADKAKELIHGYYACVSFVDAQVGRLLEKLDKLKLSDNTVVILWGDHGWKLGEHNMWCKHTNYENDAWAPMIIRSPGRHKPGIRTKALVEFVDIYPTLCDLAGGDIPDYCQGKSFVPLLAKPDKPWKKAAISQYPRSHGGKSYIGYSIRTKSYRYVEWIEKTTGKIFASELYDHEKDPQENQNLVDDAAYRSIISEHHKIAADLWKKSQ
jgi:arylsulfatase A-like enzyme